MTNGSSLRELLLERTQPAAPELVKPRPDGAVRCVACGHRCLIRPGKAGVCHVRHNVDGELRVPGGYVAGLQVDPIEKKPFYHAYPGNNALSFGMLGCDLHCGYCQNWVSSQVLRDDAAVAMPHDCTPAGLVDIAEAQGVPVMVSTYNEPLITADWAMKIFSEARKAGIVCGFVSNGNATPEVLEFLRPVVDLYKVDLKSFQDKSYRQLGCTLNNVLESIQRLKDMGFWLELVTLLIPGFNNSDAELREMAAFIAGVSTDIPWHVTAFHPDYKMTDPPRTRVNEVIRAYDIGRDAGLKFVYPGNLSGAVGDRESTFCPACNAMLITREGFHVRNNRMVGNCCPDCGEQIPGEWEQDAPVKSRGTGIPQPLGF